MNEEGEIRMQPLIKMNLEMLQKQKRQGTQAKCHDSIIELHNIRNNYAAIKLIFVYFMIVYYRNISF